MNQKPMQSNTKERWRALDLMLKELSSAEKKFPDWPEDMIHRSAIITEKLGGLVQACRNYENCEDSINHVIEEAVQVGAMALRFIISIEKMDGITTKQ